MNAALNVVAWVATAAVLASYFAWTVLGKPARWFHAANALGGLPLLALNVSLGAWQIVPITATFTVVGWVGLLEPSRTQPAVSRRLMS